MSAARPIVHAPDDTIAAPLRTVMVAAAAERADELRALRATTAEQTRQIRLRRAVEALEAAGFTDEAVSLSTVRPDSPEWCSMETTLRYCRDVVRTLRVSLTDGSDEPRYAACGAALEALGALWSCL